MHDPSLTDPNDLRHQDPEARGRIFKARGETMDVIAKLAADLVVARAGAHGALTRVNAALRRLQIAEAHLVVFLASVGAQAIGRAKTVTRTIWVALVVAAAAEAGLAFPGVRFASGQLGEIQHPWQDPLSMTIAAVIGLMSLAVAHAAARELACSERSVMGEPERAAVADNPGVPEAVQRDPANVKLSDVAPTSALADRFGASDGPARSALEHQAAVPPSEEVTTEEKRRYISVLLMDRGRALSRGIAAALITLGVVLWTVIGVMRAGYLERLPEPAANQATGLFAQAIAPAAGSPGTGAGWLEVAIVVLSVVIFLAQVAIVFAIHTPAEIRRKALEGHAKQARADHAATVKRAEPALRAYEEARANMDVARAKGRVGEQAAGLRGG